MRHECRALLGYQLGAQGRRLAEIELSEREHGLRHQEHHAAVPLMSDPNASGSVIQMAQFYEDSVLKPNQKILNFSDQASYINSGDDGSLTAAPTAAQVAVQTYITAQCGYLRP